LRGAARRPVLARAASGTSLLTLDQPPALKPGQVAELGIRDGDHVAAVSPVASVRSALRDVLLPPERQPAVTAAACLDVDLGAIVDPGARREGYSASTTAIERRSPLRRNSATPSRTAKIVSSLPILVPGPGRNFEPRWRTMIWPARTSWPAKILTPRYCGFESRPFFDEPMPFL